MADAAAGAKMRKGAEGALGEKKSIAQAMPNQGGQAHQAASE
jgi:hypothetical protein